MALSPQQLDHVLELIETGAVSAANASSRLLPDLLERPGSPQERAEALGLVQNTDTDFLRRISEEVVAAHPDKAAAYRRGKKGLIGFFMGEVMRGSKGSAEPKETQALLRDLLESEPRG